MEVYFVRHGQTNGNLARRHQHPDTQLNEVGVEQINTVAKEIVTLEPTHIISSTQLRAVESASIISRYCDGLIPYTNEAFEELKRPSFMIGNRYVGLTTAWYVWRWFWGSLSDGGGESYGDFLNRIKQARNYLESLPDDSRVIVVSHAVFTNMFVEHLCSDKPMSFRRAVKRFWHILKIRNASIIHIKYIASGKGICRWNFVSSTKV